jgi:hypothetical protein
LLRDRCLAFELLNWGGGGGMNKGRKKLAQYLRKRKKSERKMEIVSVSENVKDKRTGMIKRKIISKT